MEDYEISLKGLFYSVFKHWRSVIIAALLCAVLANVFIPVFFDKQPPSSNAIASTIKSLEQGMDEDEVEEARNIADVYLSLQDEYDSAMSYLGESIKMRMDANAAPTYAADFLITAEGTNDVTQFIAGAYRLYLTSDEVSEKLRAKLALDADMIYVKELIGCSSSAASEITDGGTAFSCKLSITFTHPEEAVCKDGGAALSDEVISYSHTLTELFGEFKLSPIGSKYSVEYSGNILTNQQSRLANLNSIKSMLDQTQTLVGENQTELFNSYILSDILSEPSENDSEANDETADTSKAVPSFSLKNSLIGAVIGIFILAAIYALIYFLPGTVKEKDDISTVFEIGSIGSYRVSERRKRLFGGIDRALEKSFVGKELSSSENLDIICTNIRVAAEKSALRNIYFTGTHDSAETKNVETLVCKKLAGAVGSVECGASPLTDHESLEKMANSDGVVIFERVAHSNLNDIKAVLDYCTKYDVKVIGYVILN